MTFKVSPSPPSRMWRPWMADASPSRRAPPGGITLVRHGEPALSRKIRLSAREYRAWWARYEEGGLKAGQTPPPILLEAAARADVLICSTRLRAIETAAAITGGRACAENPLYIEAPLPPPPLPGWLRLPPRWWGVLSRFCWWLFGYADGQESYTQALDRARLAARGLIAQAERGEEILLIAHGFFNLMIGRALKAEGWRLTVNQGFRYWSARRFEAPPASRSSPA